MAGSEKVEKPAPVIKKDVADKDLKSKEEPEPDKKKAEEELELSEEDKLLQSRLNELVDTLKQPDATLYRAALELLRQEIRSSTSSMTSVPKPLKFLRPHYADLKLIYDSISTDLTETKCFCADIVSVLGMTMSDARDCLKYRLLGSEEPIGSWGHEYVRHLAGEVAQEWGSLSEAELTASKPKLMKLVHDIVPYHMSHNAEAEACDLLMEIEHLSVLHTYVDKNSFHRVALYLLSCVPYVAEPEDAELLKTTLAIFRKFEEVPDALRCAIQLNEPQLVRDIFLNCSDKSVQKQLAFMLARQQMWIELDPAEENYDELVEIMSNSQLNTNFLSLARELDIMEPKTPEDIYKTHLEPNRPFSTGQVDSAKQNLSASLVNAFVNCGFGQDKLVTDDGNKWMYKNKEHGMLSAAASLGLVLLWDVDGGLTHIDKYLYSTEDYIKAGALLACGIVSCGIRSDIDPALALLSDYVTNTNSVMRVGAILGLGLAYTGSNREDVLTKLLEGLETAADGSSGSSSSKQSWEVVGMTGVACGLIAVGTCNAEVVERLLALLIERSESGGASDLSDTFARFLPLAIGLCYLGKQEACETVLLTLDALCEPMRSMSRTLVEVCAYAGTGNVLQVQRLLHICSEHYDTAGAAAAAAAAAGAGVKEGEGGKKDKEGSGGGRRSGVDGKSSGADKKEGGDKSVGADDKSGGGGGGSDDKSSAGTGEDKSTPAAAPAEKVDLTSQQSVAVLGIALISMGEGIGGDMAFRTFGHLLRYGEPCIRRAVPLALALTSVSNPRLNILDTLSKFSHDTDSEVAHNAIFAMGIVGAGTNNARLAAMLRQLAQYHAKEPAHLFMVRLAQGLTHMGKGTLSLSPYHQDRAMMSPPALAALLTVVVACLDVNNIILGKSHYLLYCLAPAIHPRLLVTFDEDLKQLTVPVRVGQAVDVVGQAGKPKTITGFQTHTTPVLLAYGERAELTTDEYTPLTPVLEGFVILRKNPHYRDA